MKNNDSLEIKIENSLHIGFLLSLAGGFQDAYSYHCRDRVFANAQTGNIVLFGGHLISGEFSLALRYFFPVLSFITGIYIAEWLKYFCRNNKKFHWRQITLAIQILLMIIVGFMPESTNILANIFLSFACAIQLESFKKFRGIAFATTMCIGNMRNATEFLANYHITKDKDLKYKSTYYYSAILIFSIGAILGFVCSKFLSLKSIWISIIPLFLALILLTLKENDKPLDNNLNKNVKDIEKNIINDVKEEFSYIKKMIQKK